MASVRNSLHTSPDGQWAAHRRGREVVLYAGAVGAPVGQLELPSEDADVALVGPPDVLVVVHRGDTPKVTLHQPPYLDLVAQVELEAPMRLAAVTGPRLALVSADGKSVVVVRAAGRALSTQNLDPGGVVEMAVGLDRNQVLMVLPRKLEVWDAVSARPLLRMALQLPPPPRQAGSAAGHVWATRAGSDEVYVYRLSDGRPFQHFVGAPVEGVVCHPASPLLVLQTPRGLVRLNCFAHSLHVVDSPWSPPAVGAPAAPLALLVQGEDVRLIGIGEGDAEPWHVPIGGSTVAAVADAPTEEAPAVAGSSVVEKLAAHKSRGVSPGASSAASTDEVPAGRLPPVSRLRAWRDPLATYGTELSRGVDGDVPTVALDTELGELAHRLGLAAAARRALTALYSLYLVGQPALSLARAAHALGEWSEALGQGELASLQLVRRKGGTVALRRAVTDLLDGVTPGAIRIVGGAPGTPKAGLHRVARDGRADAAIETTLATEMGRIAVVTGRLKRGVLEARLHGATALTWSEPETTVALPAGGGLVVVTEKA